MNFEITVYTHIFLFSHLNWLFQTTRAVCVSGKQNIINPTVTPIFNPKEIRETYFWPSELP